jgi:hypothetical protein
VRAGHLLRWVVGGAVACACLDAKTRVLAVGALVALASTTCNNFIADLLFLSKPQCHTPHSLQVAGAPCVHPYLGEWALGGGMGRSMACGR